MGPSITAATTVRRAAEFTFSELDGELFAIDAAAGYCYSLNESAGAVWSLIDAPTTVGALCARLREEYAVDEATCLSEVGALLVGLQTAGLVTVGDGPAG